jgi:hypothetical protein
MFPGIRASKILVVVSPADVAAGATAVETAAQRTGDRLAAFDADADLARADELIHRSRS